MKKVLSIITLSFALLLNANGQVTVESIPLSPQSGQYNYFSVKVTLPQTYDHNVVVEGFIQEEDNSGSKQAFSLTITSGNLTAQTSANFFAACPACGAETEFSSLSTQYAGVNITYEADACILKFNSLADANTVLNQLEADDDSYNDNYENQYPNLSADELDDLEDQNGFDEMKVYKDFDQLFNGFCSKRAELESIEDSWLSNSFNGTDPDDLDFTYNDAENTIFNNNYSFKINNDVYQLTSSGMYKNGIYQNEGQNAYQKLVDFSDYLTYGKLSGPRSGSLSISLNQTAQPSYFTDCKSNKKSKVFQVYDNGNKRVRATVAITSIIIRNGVNGKLKHYKKKNGNWKRSKAEMAVYCAGTYYWNLCSESESFTDRFPLNNYKKRKKVTTRRHSPGHIPEQGSVWKTYSGEIATYGEVNGALGDQLLLTF
jgi:hypothetical protein